MLLNFFVNYQIAIYTEYIDYQIHCTGTILDCGISACLLWQWSHGPTRYDDEDPQLYIFFSLSLMKCWQIAARGRNNPYQNPGTGRGVLHLIHNHFSYENLTPGIISTNAESPHP